VVTALFGAFGPIQSLIPQKVVPHPFFLDVTYHAEGFNWTIANACKCIAPNASYPIDIFFVANLWLNATGELDVGKSVDFVITIGNVEAYLPSAQQVISRNTLDVPNNYIDAVYLTNSVFASNDSNAVIKLISIPSTNISGFPTPGWTAKATITFTVPGETYLRLDIPYGAQNFETNVNQTRLIPIVNIQPQSTSESSDVLSLREWIVVGGSFGWLGLGGVLVLFLKEKKGQENETDEEAASSKNSKDQGQSSKRRTTKNTGSPKKGSPVTNGKKGED
jgi:hypothetical protein